MQHRIPLALAMLMSVFASIAVHAGEPQGGEDLIHSAQDWEDASAQFGAATRSAATRKDRREALINRAWQEGTAPVIVLLKEAQTDSATPALDIKAKRAATRRQALQRLGLRSGRDRAGMPVKTFDRFAGFAMRGDAIDIEDLLDNPDVVDVVEDVAYPPALMDSMPMIGASLNYDFSGYSGVNQSVAILDTGVDRNHPFLQGKVISEACYSTNGSSRSGIVSLCPQRVTASTATGSAMPCSWASSCSHGTHVAGIAAGQNGSYTGVAKDAKVIAIQVFTGFPSSSCGGSPCVMAYTSDIIKGLERVFALRGTYSVAAANLSLGGGRFTGNCDSDPAKPAIDALRSAGIATVIASGNSGYIGAISAPACVSTAVSVGSVCDDRGTYCDGPDSVATYSNSADFLSLLAPGSLITSSVPGGGYSTWHGTSMATPHVAGAWAVLKQASQGASVDSILDALRATGKSVTDSGITSPRVQIAAAIDQLAGGGGASGSDPDPEPEPEPEVPDLVAPTLSSATNVTRSSFNIGWTSVPNADGYRIDVATISDFRSGSLVIDGADVGTYTAVRVSGLRRWTTYYVRVRAYNADEIGPNSATRSVRTRWR